MGSRLAVGRSWPLGRGYRAAITSRLSGESQGGAVSRARSAAGCRRVTCPSQMTLNGRPFELSTSAGPRIAPSHDRADRSSLRGRQGAGGRLSSTLADTSSQAALVRLVRLEAPICRIPSAQGSADVTVDAFLASGRTWREVLGCTTSDELLVRSALPSASRRSRCRSPCQPPSFTTAFRCGRTSSSTPAAPRVPEIRMRLPPSDSMSTRRRCSSALHSAG